MKRSLLVLAALSIFSFGLAAPVRAGLIHDYELNGTFADSYGGPSLISNGGSLGPTGYTFAAGQGPNVSNAIDPANYSIELGVSIDTTSGYRKLIDFKNLTTDNGLYNQSGFLVFYPVATGPTTTISPSVQFDVLLTRNGSTNDVIGYVNGVSQFSFTDSTNYATFTGPGNIVQLLIDDNVTGGREASSGFLDYVRIYDGPITPDQETTGPNATPEPATVTLLGVGIATMAGYGWRRRKIVQA